MVCVPHAVLVFLDEFLLVVLIFHPVLAWDDKVGCNSTLWARPTKKNRGGAMSPTLQSVAPFTLPFGCRDPAPILCLRLCVNVSEVARGEILRIRLWRRSISELNQCEWIGRLCVSRACRSDSLTTTQVLHSTT